MFKNPFSFDGRIRRTEYGLSIIISTTISVILSTISIAALGGNDEANAVSFLLGIPHLWFIWSAGAKRCHDLGNSGWWQLIPFYGLWLLFQDGQPGENEYGENPKGIQLTNNHYNQSTNLQQPKVTHGVGYQNSYDGGHNNVQNSNNSFNNNYSNNSVPKSDSKEYKRGNLYN